MDPRVIDAGEVPNNAVDTNIPRMHGGNHPPPRNPYHHVVSENVLRSYPLVGELHPTTSPTTAVSSSMVFQKQQKVQHQYGRSSSSTIVPTTAPTHHHHPGNVVPEDLTG